MNDAGRGWAMIKLVTFLVYLFMFAPIIVVLILSFNASQFGGFPMTGFSLHWYGELMRNESVVRAFKTSLWIGIVTALVCTTVGTMAALALVRYEFPGKHWVNALIVGPVLVPETVLGVGLLLANRAAGMKANFGLLLLGHILLSLPYVVLVVQARLIGYEEVPSVSSAANGTFKARIDKATGEIDYDFSYEGLQGTVSQAHIHFGARAFSGGISAFLCTNLGNGPAGTPACPATSGTVTGTITAAQVVGPAGQGIAPTEFAELVRALRAGAAYANVHSTSFQPGEIRGQISRGHGHDEDDDD